MPLGVSLITAPFVIRLLGVESYGVLILIALIPTYFSFAEVGMSLASTKFGSEAYAAQDREREGMVVRTTALIAFVAASLAGSILFLFSGDIVRFFVVPEHLYGSASLALKIASVAFVINILNNVFNTPQLARLRMDLNTIVAAGFRTLGIVATPIVIYLGGGIIGAVTVLMIVSLLTLAGHLFVSGRLLNELFRPAIRRDLIGPMLKFGAPVAATLVAAALLINIEKVVLARVASVEILAYYSIAFTLASMATMFSSSMIQSLVPAFAQLLTPDKRSQLNSLYSRAIRLNLVVILPMLFVLFVIAKPLFTIWAGPDFGRESTLPFYVLLVGLFFNLLAYVSQANLVAAGRTDVIAKLNWLELIPYIALVALLTSQYGAVGAAAAWSIRVFVDSFIVISLSRRLEGVEFDFSGHAWRFLTSIVILLPAALFALIYDNNSLWLFVLVPCSIMLYCVYVYKKIFNAEERLYAIDRLQRAFV